MLENCKNANIRSQNKTKLSRDLAAPPCFSTPSGGLGLQRSAAAWLTDGRFWRRGPGRQSTCQLAFPGCFFTTKAPGLLERSRSQKRSGSFSFFLLFLCKPLFCHATLPNGGREQSRFGWEWRGKVFSVDNRGVDENFEMGVVRHERGLEDFEMGVESWII